MGVVLNKSGCTATVLAIIIFSGLIFLSNVSAATYVSGGVTGGSTWVSQNNPYHLSGNVVINNGDTLTIQAGTIVHLNGYQIQVYGTLLVQGQSSSKVYFFSDSNSNSQIYFSSTSTSSCVVDNVVFYAASVMVGGGSVRITNCYFSGGSSTCITVNGGNPQIISNVINGGSPQHCITINQAAATITSNILAGGHFGINNVGGSISVVDNTITNCYSGIYSTGQAAIEQNIIEYNTNDAVASRSINNDIQNNALAHNTVGVSGDGTLQNNTITNNQAGLWGQTSVSTIQYNNIFDNDENVHLTEDNIDVNAFNNWWGSVDNDTIYSRISDVHMHSNLGTLFYIPYLTAPATTLAVSSSVSVPTAPPTPTVAPSITPTPTPSPIPNASVTPTPYPQYTSTPTPYPYETYWPTPSIVHFDTPTPTDVEFGGFSIGDVTSVVVIIFAVTLAVAIIIVINRKFTRSQSPLPPPPPEN
jgi:hypothetical protein